MNLSKEWWLAVLVLGIFSAGIQELFFPNTSPLWQLPIGFTTGVLLQYAGV